MTTVSPGLLRGEVSWGDAHAAWLDSLTGDARAALLAFDPREDGRSIALPRYQWLLGATLGPTVRPLDATWRPCAGASGFEVLAEMVTPMDDGGALVLQYGVQRDAACTPQQPGVLAGTSSAECELGADVLVDRLAGTLLMTATAPSHACIP